MAKAQTRRDFLRTAPLAAAVTLPLASTLTAQEPAPPVPFQLFPAQDISSILSTLNAAPGNKDIVTAKEIAVAMTFTVEEKKAAKEFEWHQHRDHVFQVIEGSTHYELGGTPENGRLIRAGEWLAPQSTGATSITLHKGDMLMIPRMTPHKRTTADKVTFLLIHSTTPS